MNQTAAASLREFRWPVGVTGSIDAPASDVWSVISMPGNLERCHPFCKTNPVSVWPGPDSRDQVHYYNGVVYERRFLDWFDGVGYDLEIGAPGQRTSVVRWRLEAGDLNASTLNITVYPWLLQDTPVAIRWLPHIAYLRPMLQRYLTAVVRGFDWYVTTGTPVSRNQFGPHPWYSPSN